MTSRICTAIRFPQFLVALVIGVNSLAAVDWIWLEGEDAINPETTRHPWYDQVNPSQFSGGGFISHFDDQSDGRVAYQFKAPDVGDYFLWVRGNPVQTRLEFRLNDGDWNLISWNQSEDSINVAADGKPDLRFIAWASAGSVPLKSGSNTVQFRMTSDNHHHGYLDCLVFSRSPFQPKGKLKPDQIAAAVAREDQSNAGWFAFRPSITEFPGESVIDLRWLNETVAGEKGFIKSQYGQFVHADNGKPVRFWAVNGPSSGAQTPADLKREARLLARYGVNMVRIHGAVFDKNGEPDMAKVRHIQDIVEAMKSEGIYSHLSIYFPLWFSPKSGLPWLPGYNGDQHPFAALYFNPEFQAKYREWWKALLLTPSASTGMRLVDEPAVFGVEMVNEDSYFFWTFSEQNVPDPQLRILEKQFGDWLIQKYGSLAETKTTWKRRSLSRDDFENGRVAFRPLWNIFSKKTVRDQDTAGFLFQSQTEFYGDTYAFLRSLGLKGSITASNWTTASADVLGPLEKLSYTVTDFIDRHGYFSANHKGDNAAWSIREGHTYSDRSALRFDPEQPGDGRSFVHPAMDVKYQGLPSMISETTWNRPNRYRSEAPIYLAVYGCLQNGNAVVHFAFDGSDWNVKPNFWMQPWSLMSPTMMGQFPATALIYRQGLVTPGDVLADINLNRSNLGQLKGSPLPQGAAFDELRLKDVPEGMNVEPGTVIDPLIHYAGQTKVRFSIEPRSVRLTDLSSLIQRDQMKVKSSTGELELDYQNGLLVINSPKAQGASGNLAAQPELKLKNLTLSSPLDMVNVIVVPLDNQPLATSSRMLLQVMSEEKPTGFETEPAGEGIRRITQLGNDPWRVKNLAGWVQFKRAVTITPLDLDGRATHAQHLEPPSRFELLPETVYYLVEQVRPKR